MIRSLKRLASIPLSVDLIVIGLFMSEFDRQMSYLIALSTKIFHFFQSLINLLSLPYQLFFLSALYLLPITD